MKDKLIELFQNAFSKARPVIAVILVILFLIYPYLPEPSFAKISVAVALGITIMLVIFDFSKGLKERLDSIDAKLEGQSPPNYHNFNTILPILEKTLEERMLQNRDVDIYILSVSAQFTWKLLIEDTIPNLFSIGDKKNKPKLNIEFVLVRPDILENWGQNRLKMSAETTLKLISDFKTKYKSEFNEKRISLEIYEYDNIPHWHAILIDEEDLFFGKCNWQIKDNKFYLQVGQLEYNRFSKNDRFGGSKQIAWVKNWFDAYRVRAQKIAQVQNPAYESKNDNADQT